MTIKYMEVHMPNWVWVVVIVLLVLWVLDFGVFHIVGALINILLVVALIFAIIWLVQSIRIKK